MLSQGQHLLVLPITLLRFLCEVSIRNFRRYQGAYSRQGRRVVCEKRTWRSHPLQMVTSFMQLLNFRENNEQNSKTSLIEVLGQDAACLC
eukprot:2792334-Pleurochrysis_carterae.AAC.2